jgi:integrase
MASYHFLTPTKVKLYAEFGYRDDGTRARKTKTVTIKTPNSERAAQRALEAFIASSSEEKEPAKAITFKRFVEDWLNLHVSKLHYNTRKAYKDCLRLGIMDYFGNRQLASIRPLHILKFFKQEEEAGKGNIETKHTTLCSLFSCAVKWEVIENSPMDKVDSKDIPKATPKKRPRKAYTGAELAEAMMRINRAKKMRPKSKIAFKLAGLVGLRVSEIAGLREEVLDFKNNSIIIDRQLIWNQEEQRFMMAPPKSRRSRTVYVPDKFMQGELRKYVLRHKKIRIACDSAWYEFIDPDFSPEPVNLIFTTNSGRPTFPGQISHNWLAFVRREGLPELNFHGLRHSCLSYQMNHGAPVMDVQEQAGHTTAAITTGIYGHTENERRQATANIMNNIF